MRVSSPVSVRFGTQPIADYLAARFTYRSLAEWQTFVTEGKAWRGDELCQLDTIVAPGDVITCDLPETPAPNVNTDYRIVYEDDDLLVVDKPSNLRVHSKGKFVHANLIYHIRHVRSRPYPDVDLINRLDANTTGLVLLGRNKPAVQAMAAQFRRNQVAKTYFALVSGALHPTSGRIALPLGPVAGAKVPRFEVNETGGKSAETLYECVQSFENGVTLVKLMPLSGRTHQLRVHMAAIGHPLLGDALYQLDDDAYLDWVKRREPLPGNHGLTRQALHAARLTFLHPTSGKLIKIEAPLPPDFADLIA